MDNKTKLERIIALLKGKGLVYKLNHHSELCGIDIDIYIPKYRIAVFEGYSQEQYVKVKRKYAPLFVRDEETEDFIVEKMENLLEKREEKLQWLQKRNAEKEANRIYAEECERRHQEKLARRKEAKARHQRAKNRRKRIVRYEKVMPIGK